MDEAITEDVLSEPCDLLVIGAGVHGAFAAWDAALRGLRVVLIDRGDFGAATSANSMKLVHGGLRYLQTADIRRLRRSVLERASLLRQAPHLVREIACAVPVGVRGAPGRLPMALALKAADGLARVIELRQSRAGGTQRSGRLLDRDGFARHAGTAAPAHFEGGALWYDAIMESPDRLLIGIVRAAIGAGARALNYVEAVRVRERHGRVSGVEIRADSRTAFIPTRCVLNAAGPWVGEILGVPPVARFGARALAYNVIAARKEIAGVVGVPHQTEGRMLFAVPWRGHVILGTGYRLTERAPRSVRPSRQDVERLLADFNRAAPGLHLDEADVTFSHAGLLPAHGHLSPRGAVVQRDRPILIDHGRSGGPAGLISMLGVKWTTARAVAEEGVNLCQRALGRSPTPGGTFARPIAGGDVGELEAFLAALHPPTSIPGARWSALGRLYGTIVSELASIVRTRPDLAAPVAAGAPLLGAQVVHAVRFEMARTLGDILLRRTDAGTAGHPGEHTVAAAARLMASELGWPAHREAEEIDAVRHLYRLDGTSAV